MDWAWNWVASSCLDHHVLRFITLFLGHYTTNGQGFYGSHDFMNMVDLSFSAQNFAFLAEN